MARSPYSRAATQILALVSGLPGDERRLRRLVMLQAHIDDSRTGEQTLVLAGYIATAEQWASFTDQWVEHLRLAGLPYFKMSEIASGGFGEENRVLAASFYRIIEKHVLASVACVVPCDQLRSVVRRLGLPPIFENPYFIAFKAIINVTAQHQTDMRLSEPIDFIFDEQKAEKEAIRKGWDAYRESVTPDVRALTGNDPVFRDDKIVRPLQSADLYAWWVRKWWEEKGTIHFKKLPFPWSTKEFPRLSIVLDEPDLLTELTKIRKLMEEAGMLPSFELSVSFTFNGKEI